MTKSREAGATSAVWSALSGDLLAWFEHRGPAGTDPEELLHETFLRIHVGLPELQDPARLTAWARQVASNVLVDSLRGRGREGRAIDDDLPERQDEPTPRERAAEWIGSFVRRLAPVDREVIELVDLEGLPQKDVARRLGLSLTATKSRVQRARARLREALLQCCEFEFDTRGDILDWKARTGTGCRK